MWSLSHPSKMLLVEALSYPDNDAVLNPRSVRQQLAQMIVVGAAELVFDDDVAALVILKQEVEGVAAHGVLTRDGSERQVQSVRQPIDVPGKPWREVSRFVGPTVAGRHPFEPGKSGVLHAATIVAAGVLDQI